MFGYYQFGRTVHKTAELSPNWRGQMGKKLQDEIYASEVEVVDLRGFLYSALCKYKSAHLFSSCETAKE